MPHDLGWALAAALLLLSLAASADPHGDGVLGSRKLAQAQDCRGLVAFSGVSARPASGEAGNATAPGDASLGTKLGFRDLLTDKSVGWSRETGEFTSICPGLYQFAFSGARLTLRKREGASQEWKAIVSTTQEGNAGGSHLVLLEMDVGDVVAVWLAPGASLPPEEGDSPHTSFTGHRIAKK